VTGAVGRVSERHPALKDRPVPRWCGKKIFERFAQYAMRSLVGKEKNLELLPMRNPNLFFACF